MAERQGWVTYAASDNDGMKALVLARSLKLSITRRQLVIFISDQVSDLILKLLQSEFDSCIKISKGDVDWSNGLQEKSFSFIVQVCCWKLKKFHQFVFLDCNCLVLKNSDELFKQNGFGFVEKSCDQKIISVISGSAIDSKGLQALKKFEKDSTACSKIMDTTDFLLLDEKFCSSLNLKEISGVTGKEIRIINFLENHPLDWLVGDHDLDDLGTWEQALVRWWLNLVPTEMLSCIKNESLATIKSERPVDLQMNKSVDKNIINKQDLELLDELKDSIAIVGMAFRFPGANTIDEFWSMLFEGREGIIKVPSERWTKDRCFSQRDNIHETQAGFLKCPIDEMDGKFFGLNPAELAFMDPQQRLMLHIFWEGIENAGIDPTSLKKKLTGVFGGWWRQDYKEMLQEARITELDFFRAYMGNTLGTVTARISHYLELTGPCISTESGCSTSIVGVDMACNSLRDETSDIAFAIGVNLFLHPFTVDAVNFAIAMDGRSKTFDEKADGFGRAEGCGVLVLKRFADAAADGDKIWGVIRGSSIVQEGLSKSMGTPTVECEALSMSLALKRAGVAAKDVSFVEFHGTGTPVGDPLEVAAVAQVYSKDREDILIIGSVKTNIGHTESVSGIAGIVKTVLSLQNEIIPQHLNMETLNPEINLNTIPAQIPLTPIKWERKAEKPRIAGVSSFGITGTDGHVIIQETPELLSVPVDIAEPIRPLKILTVSAKSQEALDNYLTQYKKYLANTTDNLEDIEMSLHLGRGHFSSRMAVLGETKAEILQNIEKHSFEMKSQTGKEEAQKICFLFTGQGSQYAEMGKELYETSLVFKSHFDKCENYVTTKYNFSIKEAIWGNSQTLLSRTLYSQTSIFCIEYCLLKLWDSWGVKPDYVLGHSLGEFSAAVAAGFLAFEDALKLVLIRSQLIDKLPQGKMIVLKENVSSVERLIEKHSEGHEESSDILKLDVAAVNSPEQTVLAGETESILKFAQFCENNNVKTHILDATHAFHSRHMDPMLEEYKNMAEKVISQSRSLPNGTCKYISGMEGKLINSTEMDANYWVRHTRNRVNFLAASNVIFESGCSLFLEIGPQPILTAMIRINSDTADLKTPIIATLPSIRKNESNWKTILLTLSKLYVNGLEISWANYHRFLRSHSSKLKVDLPSYPFQMKSHWFELNDDNTSPIHPLVGCPMPNPSSLKLFKNNLNIVKAPFLNDHVVGNKIIFPGAGFLEMCLVSGHAALQCAEGGSGGLSYSPPLSSITLTDFKIVNPLCLKEQGDTELQVVVEANSTQSGGETLVTIYSKIVLDKETWKWIPHASGLYSPFGSTWDDEKSFLSDSLSEIRERCSEKLSSAELTYKKLEEYGMKFGPTFQSIEQVWRSPTNTEVCLQIKVPADHGRYICHPVVIDAMFQSLVISLQSKSKSLHVPFSVSKFVWSGRITSCPCFIHCKILSEDESKGRESSAVLMDNDGQLVAVMVGVELVETTVGNIMAILEGQRMSYPTMYEDVWREQLGPMEKRLISWKFDDKFTSENTAQFNRLTEEDTLYYEQCNQLCAFYMIKALLDLGFDSTAKVGETFEMKELINRFSVQQGLSKLFDYFFVELSKEGYFKLLEFDETGDRRFELLNVLPVIEVVEKSINMISKEMRNNSEVEAECVSATGNVMADLLTGRQSTLSILFPEDPEVKGPAELYYTKSKQALSAEAIANKVFPIVINGITKQRGDDKSITRILEIGAGVGSFTEKLLPHMLEDGAQYYEYTYTDISPVFFSKGEKIFENSKMKVNYKLLNIEEDPLVQGFIPHHYDVVVASFVIHATKDVKESLDNVRTLLAPSGLCFLVEFTQPHRCSNLIFGALEGYWRFTDTDLRPHNCEMEMEKWEAVLNNLKFESTTDFHFYNFHGGLIFSQMPSITAECWSCSPIVQLRKKSWIVFSDGGATSHYITEKLLQLGRHVILAKQNSTEEFENPFGLDVYTVYSDNPASMLAVMESIPATELEGILYLWCLKYKPKQESLNNLEISNSTDNNYEDVCQPFLHLCQILVHLTEPKVFVFTRGNFKTGEESVKFPTCNPIIGMARSLTNENPLLAVKCVDLDPFVVTDYLDQESIAEIFILDGEFMVAYRNSRRCVLRLLTFKPLNTALSIPKSSPTRLVLPPTNNISDLRFGTMEKLPLEDTKIHVKVKAYGLNFRDLFVVLKPDPMFENWNVIGLDFSGVVTAVGSNITGFEVGDPVFGVNRHGCAMPSHLSVEEHMMIKLPENMTFAEGATLPAVAATGYVCLIDIAKIKEGDVVLIHAASGGVGLCAIQIALDKKCKIIATAGSERKRAFLRSHGIEHVFNSRNTDFEKEIRQALGGSGVDVVLNCLTSEGFKEASLALCNENARFVEMSKLNVWTEEEVKTLRPDIQYDVVDLSQVSEEKIKENMEEVKKFVAESTVKPLPYVRFDASEIREALNYLQKAKHIGKIVCMMPEEGSVNNNLESQNQRFPLFNDRSSYMITGGLGGIGFEVAKWMIKCGAKHLFLVGRSSPKEKTASEIQTLISEGVNIRVMSFDVGDITQCKQLVEAVKSENSGLPKLRGIMHAAGVLSDAPFDKQTWDSYEKVFNSKVRGSFNLHHLTKKEPLEFFVMFSSIVANFGSMAQSNHCAANVFLDGLTQYRNSVGLPAMTINWGQWGQVGVAAELEVAGLRPFTALQGISALEKLMRCNRVQTGVFEVDLLVLIKGMVAAKKYLEEIKTNKGDLSSINIEIDEAKFWKDYESATTHEEKYQVIKGYICIVIRRSLKMDEHEVIDDDDNFQDLGMDSLMMIEMKNTMQSTIGKKVKITVNSVKDCKTVRQLSHRVVELISEQEELPEPTNEELIELIKEDSVLEDDIQPDIQTVTKCSEFRSVLITGATGNLGPYVLREIFRQNPNVTKIYCLLRDNRIFATKDRLKLLLTDKKLLAEIHLEKIECISGDIVRPNLGLSEEDYGMLVESVDAVYHLAAKASIEEFYAKTDRLNHSRTVNVVGMKNVLRFVCDKKTKHLYFASLILATTKLDTEGRFWEDWPNEGEFDNSPNAAYPISKYICEQLLHQAVERGLPAKSFRFPIMGGDSILGGNISLTNSTLHVRMIAYLHMGVMPARNVPIIMVPVDICAELSVKLFLNEAAGAEVYNISNPNVGDELELGNMAEQEFGYKVDSVEFDEFIERVEKIREKNPNDSVGIIELIKKASNRAVDVDEVEDKIPDAYSAWLAGNKDVFLSQKLVKYLPEYPGCMEKSNELLKNDLKFAKDTGLFSRLGLK